MNAGSYRMQAGGNAAQGNVLRLRKRRLKWLGSGSVLAAAIAVATAVSTPLAAQSAQPIPRAGGGALNEAGPALPGNVILGIQGGPERVAPMRTAVKSVPAPIATQPYVDAKGITLDAPRLPVTPPATTTTRARPPPTICATRPRPSSTRPRLPWPRPWATSPTPLPRGLRRAWR